MKTVPFKAISLWGVFLACISIAAPIVAAEVDRDELRRTENSNATWREITEKSLMEATAALGKLDFTTLKSRAEALRKAIKEDDLAQAQIFADKLDECLSSKCIGACMRFIIIQAKDGTEAAERAVQAFLQTAELATTEKEFFRSLPSLMAKADPEDTIDIVFTIVYLVCEVKFGQGGGALPVIVRDKLKKALGMPPKEANKETAPPVQKAK